MGLAPPHQRAQSLLVGGDHVCKCMGEQIRVETEGFGGTTWDPNLFMHKR